MAAITLTDLTNSTSDTVGNGVFDVLIQVVERHIENQYEENRITGTDYATVYLGSMQSVLSESIKFLLSEQLADKQAETETEKALLIAAQTLGFKSDTKQKTLKQMIEGNSVYASLAGTGNVPEAYTETSIDQLAQEILDDVDSGVIIQVLADVPPQGDSVAVP